jgi:hypothetical protein
VLSFISLQLLAKKTPRFNQEGFLASLEMTVTVRMIPVPTFQSFLRPLELLERLERLELLCWRTPWEIFSALAITPNRPMKRKPSTG